ncbi:MAG: zinc metallopeptidase [Acidaminobacteraceae bacterium]
MFIMIPFIIFAMYTQNKVKRTYAKYKKINNTRGVTGEDVANRILRKNEIYDVKVEMTGGVLSDHYDPRSKVVRLSRDNFYGTSLAALAIAAHECGHAIQHDTGYGPLNIRATILPVANIGSQAAWPLAIAGLFFNFGFLIDIGIVLFMAAFLFQIITLPVEFNASSRAIAILSTDHYLDQSETNGAKKVLNAAALTYVAAAAVALGNLIRLLVLRNSRD